ncbi:hypothetical protein M9H77_25948 [Catharanthus roseus]|uniref:Uncharacterized protein n=1 Tax=Catharanthus roseus TaxID=4058 RepID=A0ACC0AA56_CATRO|nr:hypothetical protein M9H77_25948 [Catharanthus roseus]
MEENHISKSGGELILNNGSGEEGELREGSDDAEELQESRGREIEQVLPINLGKYFNNIDEKLEMHDTAGLRPSKSVRILEVQVRGPDKLCLPRDSGDADCKNRMFIRMHKKNSDFFHLIRMDEEVAYEEFNDVVHVDLTYLVNRYKMPFYLTCSNGGSSACCNNDRQCENIGNAIKEVMPTKIRQYYI